MRTDTMQTSEGQARLLKALRLADAASATKTILEAQGETMPAVEDYSEPLWAALLHIANLQRAPHERTHRKPSPKTRTMVASIMAERARLDAMTDEELFAGLGG